MEILLLMAMMMWVMVKFFFPHILFKIGSQSSNAFFMEHFLFSYEKNFPVTHS